MLGLALVLLGIIHFLTVVGLVRTYLCMELNPGSFVCSWLRMNLAMGSEFFGIAVWALLTWRCWLPAKRQDSPPPPSS